MTGRAEEALRAATALIDTIEAELAAARSAVAAAQAALESDL
ncbi:hypothetical protein [Jatrophihabitans sp.]|nr:hypothetical protein [Jatrophihabitans sp.]